MDGRSSFRTSPRPEGYAVGVLVVCVNPPGELSCLSVRGPCPRAGEPDLARRADDGTITPEGSIAPTRRSPRRWMLGTVRHCAARRGCGRRRPQALPLLTCGFSERTTGFEPATPTLARWCSTAEPRPRGASSLGAPSAVLQPSHYRVPVDPNPPSPRLDGGSSSTQAGLNSGTATITSWAIRSPRPILTLWSRSRFTTEQISSPGTPHR